MHSFTEILENSKTLSLPQHFKIQALAIKTSSMLQHISRGWLPKSPLHDLQLAF